jgi:hypothetical protein
MTSLMTMDGPVYSQGVEFPSQFVFGVDDALSTNGSVHSQSIEGFSDTLAVYVHPLSSAIRML